MRYPVIVPGDTAMATWCATCQLPTRLRVELHAETQDGPVLAVFELCPGCGANHATPMITVTQQQRRRFSLRHPVASVATAVNRAGCEARGLTPTGCAYGECLMPGSWDHTFALREDIGTTTYLFCKPAHLEAWLEQTGLGFPGQDR